MEDKTFKREAALIVLIFLGLITWEAAKVNPMETLKLIIYPGMAFVALAFGLDWSSRQK